MAWYYGTYSCGHEGRTNVIGKTSQRQWKIEKHFEGICEECLQKKREADNKKAIEKSEEYEFPELVGTEKQIAWANTIRMEFYEYCERNEIIADNVIINEVSSKFWIDNRFDIKSETFLHNYEIKREEKEINKRLISEDTVKPSEIKHDGIVEIVEKENKICLYYEKNPYFIDLVKSLKYKWDGAWSRELSEMTGNFSDRAAEIGHMLLKNGFCICIHDKETLDKAISGEFRPEHTRWIYSRTDTKLLALKWNGWNDELYKEARKIQGSKWDSPSVVVDVSHYRQVEEFAFENGFKFTSAALKKIEEYKKQITGVEEVAVL